VGLVSAIFAFYEEPTGGLPLWVDIRTVRAGAAGGYTMLLGGGTELPADLLTTGVPRWLSVQPNGHGEQIRVEFAAVSPTLHSSPLVIGVTGRTPSLARQLDDLAAEDTPLHAP
jgi:hypothetical protein